MTAGRYIPPPPVEPVRNGTAEQLARVAHFRDFEHVQPEELDAIAHYLIGDVGDPIDRDVLWAELRADCLTLWHLVTDDWSERDLDEVPEADWARHEFATGQQEIAHRYQITRDRLCLDIERAVWLARYTAAEARRIPTAVA